MADKVWVSREYGHNESAGTIRAKDISSGGEIYWAPVGAQMILDANENVIGIPTNPVHITGKVNDAWEVVSLEDYDRGSADKAFTVPEGYEYEILSVFVRMLTDATAADRQLQVDFRDSNDEIISQCRPGTVQTASITGNYIIAPAVADLVAFRDTDYLMTPIPPTLFLTGGEDIHIYENNDAAAGDELLVLLRVARKADTYSG